MRALRVVQFFVVQILFTETKTFFIAKPATFGSLDKHDGPLPVHLDLNFQEQGKLSTNMYIHKISLEDSFNGRTKRSKSSDHVKTKRHDDSVNDNGRKVIHIPPLFIDSEMDGFQNVFYEVMITASLCLTSEPGLDRHELVDELEVLLCNGKGYGNLLKAPEEAPLPRSKRNEAESKEHVSSDHKWNMNKTHFDTLWKSENNGSTTPHPLGNTYHDEVDYDYESGETRGTNATGWEDDDVVEDPSGLDYMTWPQFLPDGVQADDDLRKMFHSHNENLTLDYVRVNLLLNQPEVPFEKRLFALNQSSYLCRYYENAMKLGPYNMKPLLINFFDKRQRTLDKFQRTKLTSITLRQILFLFTVDVHHVNCFNRHLRYYGYMMKKPAGINGDTITNGARLARGIIMRSLELIRHVPQYNYHRKLLLRFLIAALHEHASLSKNLTTIVGENDYIEMYEVASYLEHLLKFGSHPDDLHQDLFVQETRFYSHHFMNTLTL